jgi:hypothetical protein
VLNRAQCHFPCILAAIDGSGRLGSPRLRSK